MSDASAAAFISDFGRWALAVVRHYWFVIGGTTLGVIGLIVQQYLPNGRLEPWPFYALCAVSVIGAIFLAWREEYQRAEESGKPKFAVEIHGASSMVGSDGGTTLVVLAVRVTNVGASSAILGYAVEYVGADGQRAYAQLATLDREMVFTLPQGAYVFRPEEMLPNRAEMLSRGDTRPGRIACILSGHRVTHVRDGGIGFRVCATDYLKVNHWSELWHGSGQVDVAMFMTGEPVSRTQGRAAGVITRRDGSRGRPSKNKDRKNPKRKRR
jgi:hypothetical protein